MAAGIVVVVLALAACAVRAHHARPAGAPSLVRGELSIGGLTRTFAWYSPEAKGPLPAVIALHGRLGQGEDQDRLSNLAALGREKGFVVAFPDGVDRSWNDARGGTPASQKGIDDLGFLGALVDWLVKERGVDPKRVYLAGMSNGGFMTATAACRLGGRFAAVALVAATVPKSLEGSCAPGAPVPFAVVAGDEDPLVPYGGGFVRRGAGGEILSAQASAELFARLDGCGAPSSRKLDADPSDGTTTEVLTWSGCTAGSEVRFYTVHGGGHTWPGGLQYLPEGFIGRTSHDFEASRELWDFFAANVRP